MRVILRIGLGLTIVAALYLFIFSTVKEGARPKVDPRLEPYVQEWERDMQRAGVSCNRGYHRILKIVVADIPWAYAGLTDVAARQILINTKQMETGEMRIRCAVYHELGHAVFKLEHNSCEIMEEKCQSEEYLQENWVELQQEYIEACRANRFEANN